MKKVLALFALAALASCSSTKKGTTVTNWLGKNVTLISATPENGTATAERKASTTMSLQATSELYPVMMFDETKTVISYEYTRNSSNEPHADDFYREELFMEIPSSAFKKTYKNEQLQDVKLIFGKHCYCKGEAGYYKISEGTLKVNHTEKNTHISLTFKAPVTSELKTVEFTVE
jgi:hypothetical protein